MSTTLLLFWNLSSVSKKDRIDASVKLVGALEHFQAEFTPKSDPSPDSGEDEDGESANPLGANNLDALNAADVTYSIRRLVRGLASPRESSRLGFAVALTELLARINTVTCSQIVALILDTAKTHGSMTGQEERDVLFARLFGLTAVIQSGLLVRPTPSSTSASTSSGFSDVHAYNNVLDELLLLGERRSWLRESAWWTIGLAIEALSLSDVPWKAHAEESTIQSLYIGNKIWTPEKIAITLKLQKRYPSRDWHAIMSPTFKQDKILATGNYSTLARILKDSNVDEEDNSGAPKSKSGAWKPQVHFVWDLLMDDLLPKSRDTANTDGSFPEFFRILVDESLFSSTSSAEKKFWGFQIFQKALPRVQASDMPMLFTRNFMRSWINHLSSSDRYLHKAAKKVADSMLAVVKTDPTLGLTLILQLTGVHGSHQFDKLTKTKTVETILASMTCEGIQCYIGYLLKQVNDGQSSKEADVQAVNARRAWIIEQLATLIRNGAIPKDDAWIKIILDWFAVHGIFVIKKKSEKSPFLALHDKPSPIFSEELCKTCRDRLLACLADLTAQTTLVTTDEKASKVAAVASDGIFWVSKVLSTIKELDQDVKHVSPLSEIDEDDKALRQKARNLAESLSTISDERRDAARGAELLLSATLLHRYCIDEDEEDEGDADTLQSCVDAVSRMFPVTAKKSKKARKSQGAEDEPEPVDVLVDVVIGFLDQATAYMRAVANQVFALLSGSAQESTIDLILAQLERKNPDELVEDDDDDEAVGSDGDDEEDGDAEDSKSSECSVLVDDDEDLDDVEDPELRKKIEEALRVNGVEAGDSDDESEEELMDDEQMLAIDEQLAAVFKARAGEKKLGKGIDAQREATHYKNRVLDLVEAYIKKQPGNLFVLRFILPLVELVVTSGPDERQLADKATGILRSRFGKAKEVPLTVDAKEVTEILREIHSRARKAVTADMLNTLSQCSLFTTKCLVHAEQEQSAVGLYQNSLRDFITRKASRLHPSFFLDLIRRHPTVGWAIRTELLSLVDTAVNSYRQTQIFVLLQALISQMHAFTDRAGEVGAFIKALRPVLQKTVTDACERDGMTAAQLKEVLKLAPHAARQSRRVLTHEELLAAWEPSSWPTLSDTLKSCERFKSSGGLHSSLTQLMKVLNQDAETAKPVKRKADAIIAAGENVDSPAKRKKRSKNIKS